MGRKAGGYRIYDRGGWAWIDAHVGRKRVRQPLDVEYERTEDAGKAGAARYAQLVAHRVTRPEGRIRTALSVGELLAKWLDHRKAQRPRSGPMHDDHAAVFLRHFPSTRDIFADDARERFAHARTKEALRETARKELSSLSMFFEWAKGEGYITSLPSPYKLPLTLVGVRTGPQRAQPVKVKPAEAMAIIRALPKAGKGGRPLRDFFTVLWETGLRESTVARLSVPEHWRPGWRHLWITNGIDKAGFERSVPLTAKALAAVKRCAPEAGVIFGETDWRKQLDMACRLVLDDGRAKSFAPRDFRHGRTTELANSGAALTGVAHLVGHTNLSTTSEYVHTDEEMAAEALSALKAAQKKAQRRRPNRKRLRK